LHGLRGPVHAQLVLVRGGSEPWTLAVGAYEMQVEYEDRKEHVFAFGTKRLIFIGFFFSLRAGEHPDAQTLKAIEERFCVELGYSEHQLISVVNRDTDNLHIHVAINKIHPENLTIHDPKADYWIRSKLCAVLEHELGLARDRHNAKERHSRSNDMEAMSGEE